MPLASRAGAITYDFPFSGGASEFVLIAAIASFLRQDVACRVLREGDADRVDDRDHLEGEQEDQSRDQELSGSVRLREINGVDGDRRHHEHR